ncbi:MAG: ATP-binding protein [SAR324 cluster bacterium]|uniref:ATP-binding protein n=1 Tax=SAR324 cluster bacterium TaxID=2024889 RepID=A0A7X9FSA6_9DELT|nr:ATP-binding protein [SAR324 cluster bacterium]
MLKENSEKVELTEYLKELRLPVVKSCYEEMAQQAIQESLSYESYLLQVVERECEVRWQKRIERRLRESKLPTDKTLKSFDLARLPTKVHQQVNSLMDGSFVDRRENLLAFGNPGSGKTHLLCAISQELIRQNRRVLYTTSSTLVQELLKAKRNLALPRFLKKLGGYEVLFIDDIGYVQQNREEMEVLFTMLADRYEKGSILITSNLPFSGWEAIFKDPMTTAAAIDRLVHHSIILELNLPSYRMEQAKRTKAQTVKKKGLEVAEDNLDSSRDNGEN